MELQVTALNGGAIKSVNVSETTFNRTFNEPLIHQVVTAYVNFARAGTKAQKLRSEVSGGGKKPWKQKGSGRARAGSSRSPIWRKGGVVFAAKPRDYAQKVNKKMYFGAMCSILSELARQQRIIVVDNFNLDQPKTKDAVALLEKLSIKNALIVSEEIDVNLYLATRNIPNIDVSDVQGVDPLSLIQFENVVITVDAIKKLEESLS